MSRVARGRLKREVTGILQKQRKKEGKEKMLNWSNGTGRFMAGAERLVLYFKPAAHT
jgi:hypothetical protein